MAEYPYTKQSIISSIRQQYPAVTPDLVNDDELFSSVTNKYPAVIPFVDPASYAPPPPEPGFLSRAAGAVSRGVNSVLERRRREPIVDAVTGAQAPPALPGPQFTPTPAPAPELPQQQPSPLTAQLGRGPAPQIPTFVSPLFQGAPSREHPVASAAMKRLLELAKDVKLPEQVEPERRSFAFRAFPQLDPRPPVEPGAPAPVDPAAQKEETAYRESFDDFTPEGNVKFRVATARLDPVTKSRLAFERERGRAFGSQVEARRQSGVIPWVGLSKPAQSFFRDSLFGKTIQLVNKHVYGGRTQEISEWMLEAGDMGLFNADTRGGRFMQQTLPALAGDLPFFYAMGGAHPAVTLTALTGAKETADVLMGRGAFDKEFGKDMLRAGLFGAAVKYAYIPSGLRGPGATRLATGVRHILKTGVKAGQAQLVDPLTGEDMSMDKFFDTWLMFLAMDSINMVQQGVGQYWKKELLRAKGVPKEGFKFAEDLAAGRITQEQFVKNAATVRHLDRLGVNPGMLKNAVEQMRAGKGMSSKARLTFLKAGVLDTMEQIAINEAGATPGQARQLAERLAKGETVRDLIRGLRRPGAKADFVKSVKRVMDAATREPGTQEGQPAAEARVGEALRPSPAPPGVKPSVAPVTPPPPTVAPASGDLQQLQQAAAAAGVTVPPTIAPGQVLGQQLPTVADPSRTAQQLQEEAQARGVPVPAPTVAAAPAAGQQLEPGPTVAAAPAIEQQLEPEPTVAEKPAIAEPSIVEGGTHQAVSSKVASALAEGEKINNPALTKIADAAFGGTRGEGKYTPRDSYDAMEAGVNQYMEAEGLVAFDKPAATIQKLVDLTDQLPRQVDRTEEQIEFQQFSTPPAESFVVTSATGIRPGMTVLEPSAGTGNLATMARIAGAKVITNELAPRRVGLLKNLGFETHSVDAQHLNSLLPKTVQPDIVLMNPPFSATAGKTKKHKTAFGAKHVTEALARLKPGGRLVAIVGSGMAHGRPAFSKWWDKIEQKFNVRANLGIAGKHYGKYGVGVDNNILVIDKTGPTPGVSRAERIGNIIRGEDLGPADALKLLGPIGKENINEHITEAAGEPGEREAGPAVAPEAVPGERPVAADKPGVGRRRAEAEVGEGPGGAVRQPVAPVVEPAADKREREVAGDRGGRREPARGVPDTKEGRRAARVGGAVPGPKPGVVGRGREGALKREEAPPVDAGIEEESDTFVKYKVQKARFEGAAPHPANIVESATMASVEPPPLTYTPDLPAEVVEEGRVSDVQLEAIAYAGQRHEQRLPDGSRPSYWVGDGTGVGKGREIAAIIYDNLRQGRKRAVWLSESHPLRASAERDMELTGVPMDVIAQQDTKAGGSIEDRDGVLFTTYSMLSDGWNADRTRYKQMQEWVGKDFDGVIAFDESHNLKNAYAGSFGGKATEKEGTQAGAMGLELQREFPNARIVYVSATAATEGRNLGYMSRMGLWGEGAPFATFVEFLEAMQRGGLGALEMLARDLKAIGAYASRTISYEGVEYDQIVHELTREEEAQYNLMADFWSDLRTAFEEGQDNANQPKTGKGSQGPFSAFYSAQQRFFLQLNMIYQLDDVLAAADKDLADGKSVVISLYNTNEGATKKKVAEARAAEIGLDEIDFTPKDMMAALIKKSFPTTEYESVTDPSTGKETKVPVKDAAGNPVQNAENLEKQEAMLSRLADITLRSNPFDAIVNHFGPENIAEISGRKQRFEGSEYVTRKIKGIPNRRLNEHENALFQSGKKRVAVISGAAATGISLHADKSEKNQQRRVFYAMQFSWSADKTMQALGRVHRAFQASSPQIKAARTNLSGQERLFNAVGRKLASQGALAKGGRETLGGSLFRVEDLTDQYGQAALAQTYSAIGRNKIEGLTTGPQMLEQMGLLNAQGNIKDSDETNVEKFLNRIMGLHVDIQNGVFEYFAEQYARIVAAAKEAGIFDVGVEKITADSIKLKSPPETVFTHEASGAETQLVELEGTFPVSRLTWKEAQEVAAGAQQSFIGYYENTRSGKVYLVRRASADRLSLISPKAAKHSVRAETKANAVEELESKHEKLAPGEAGKRWRAELAELPETEARPITLLTGVLLPIFDKIEGLTEGRVVRIETEKGKPYVGLRVSQKDIPGLKQRLGVGVALAQAPAAEVYALVKDNRSVIELDNGWQIRMTKVHGEPRMEVNLRGQVGKGPELTSDGAFEEVIKYKRRYFIPLEDVEGPKVLGKILAKHKAVRDITAAAAAVKAPSPVAAPPEYERAKAFTTPEERAKRLPSFSVEKPQTKTGSRLVKEIEADPKGDKVGVRSIVQFVNDLIGIEQRQGTEQVSRKYPAKFYPLAHLIRTRQSASQINFHEAGHGLKHLLTAEKRNWLRGHGKELTDLTDAPGSMASAHNTSEGMAEWVRWFITDYERIGSLGLTTFIEKYLTKTHPDILDGLRDANRLYNTHLARDAAAQFRSYSSDQPPQAIREGLRDIGHAIGYGVASGFPLEALESDVFRAIRRGAVDRKSGLRQARQWRNDVFKPAKLAHQSVLGIAGEVTDIFHGAPGKRRNGVRVLTEKGEYKYLSDKSIQDIYDKVGRSKWREFEVGGWAQTVLDRYERRGLDYPGRSEGLTTDHLRSIVEDTRKFVKNFDEAYKDVQAYADALLQVAVVGGEKTPEEAKRIRAAYEHYWPLPRYMERMKGGLRGSTGAYPSSGFRRAFGSGQGISPLLDALEARTSDVISAYYWNRSMLALYDAAQATAKMKDLSLDARAAAGRSVIQLSPDVEVSAEISEEDAAEIIVDYLNEKLAKEAEAQNERPPEKEDLFSKKDISVAFSAKKLWKSVAPKAVNVIAPLRGGKRTFLQIEDPLLFHMFAGSREPGPLMKWYDKIASPITEPWKRALTRTLPFAVMNTISRDPSNAVLMGEGIEGAVKGIYLMTGLLNKLTGKWPEASRSTELFSRSLESTTTAGHKLRHNAFMRMLTEGVIVDGLRAKSLAETAAAVPGIAMSLILKPVDMLNFVTGGAYLSALGETAAREGAYIWAKKRGGTSEEANRAYQATTGNFGEHSGFADIRVFARVPGFVNPGAQITYRQYLRAADPDPAVKATAGFRLMVLALAAAVGWAVKQLISDEDDEKREKERTEAERSAYMDIKGFRLAFDYGVPGAVESFVWNTLDDQFGNRPILDKKRAARHILKRAIDIPGSPMDYRQPLLKAYLEAKGNYVWYWEKHIESPWMSRLPAPDRYHLNTPEFYKKLGRWMDWSPLKIQHIVKSGLARQLDEVIRVSDKLAKNEPIVNEAADLPLVGRLFVRNPEGWAAASVQSVARLDQRYDRTKKLVIERAQVDTAKLGSPAYLRPEIEEQWTQMNALHGAMRRIERYTEGMRHAQKRGDTAMANNMKQLMVTTAQQALANNPDIEKTFDRVDAFLERLKKADSRE